MMKQIPIFLFILIINISIVSAQEKWNLQQCTDYAIKHNIGLQKMKGEKLQAEVKRDHANKQWLPTADITTTQKFDFGRSLTRENTYQDVNSRVTTFNIHVEMPLFKGFHTKYATQEALWEGKTTGKNIQAKEDELCLQIAGLFFRCMIYKDIEEIAHQQLSLTETQLAKSRERVDAGMKPTAILSDIRAQQAQDEFTIVEARGNVKTSLIELAQWMNLSATDSGFDIEYVENKSISSDFRNNFPQLEAAAYTIKSLENGYKRIRSAYFPSVTLGASTGSNYYARSGMQNDAFSTQLKNNMQSYVYATLRIPLFDRFVTRDNLRIARISIQNQQLYVQEIKNNLLSEREKARASLVTAQQKLQTALRAVEAAQESFTHASERFAAGKVSIYDYLQAKQKLANAHSQRSQAKYDLMYKEKVYQYYNKPITP